MVFKTLNGLNKKTLKSIPNRFDLVTFLDVTIAMAVESNAVQNAGKPESE